MSTVLESTGTQMVSIPLSFAKILERSVLDVINHSHSLKPESYPTRADYFRDFITNEQGNGDYKAIVTEIARYGILADSMGITDFLTLEEIRELTPLAPTLEEVLNADPAE